MSDGIMKNFIIRDTRLKGFLPLAGWMIVSQVDGVTPLAPTFARIKAQAKVFGKIKTLFILCHGMGTGIMPDDFTWRGGCGLELGTEKVLSSNVSNWGTIKDCVENIVVYACGAAFSGAAWWYAPQYQNNGRGLMAALAKHTNAIVFAADKIQWYNPENLNFKNWEGTVYMFHPAGLVFPNFYPPTEIIDVTMPLSEPPHYSWEYIKYLEIKAYRDR